MAVVECIRIFRPRCKMIISFNYCLWSQQDPRPILGYIRPLLWQPRWAGWATRCPCRRRMAELLAFLGITDAASWRRWMLENHPDKGGDSEKFARVLNAVKSTGKFKDVPSPPSGPSAAPSASRSAPPPADDPVKAAFKAAMARFLAPRPVVNQCEAVNATTKVRCRMSRLRTDPRYCVQHADEDARAQARALRAQEHVAVQVRKAKRARTKLAAATALQETVASALRVQVE